MQQNRLKDQQVAKHLLLGAEVLSHFVCVLCHSEPDRAAEGYGAHRPTGHQTLFSGVTTTTIESAQTVRSFQGTLKGKF
jgi:hypothetical protein